MTRENILKEAKGCVCVDRTNVHGQPEDSFDAIADLWSAYLGNLFKNDYFGLELTPHDVAVMMVLLKIARIGHNPEHVDNWIDIAGYAACGGEIATEGKIETDSGETI